MTEAEINWPAALRATNSTRQADAVSALRALLLNGLRIAFQGRSDMSETQLEDFVQESLLRILSRLDQFQGRSKFSTWAQAIALNVAFTELRRKRWQDVSLEALLENGAPLTNAITTVEDQPAADTERTRLLAALQQAIDRDLTAKQRVAIRGVLRELPFDQVTALLGTNRNAAYKLLHDARIVLKKRLGAAGISGEDIQSAFQL